MCPHTAIYVSAYCYVCVLILLYVSAYYYVCVRILYMCVASLTYRREGHAAPHTFDIARLRWHGACMQACGTTHIRYS